MPGPTAAHRDQGQVCRGAGRPPGGSLSTKAPGQGSGGTALDAGPQHPERGCGPVGEAGYASELVKACQIRPGSRSQSGHRYGVNGNDALGNGAGRGELRVSGLTVQASVGGISNRESHHSVNSFSAPGAAVSTPRGLLNPQGYFTSLSTHRETEAQTVRPRSGSSIHAEDREHGHRRCDGRAWASPSRPLSRLTRVQRDREGLSTPSVPPDPGRAHFQARHALRPGLTLAARQNTST